MNLRFKKVIIHNFLSYGHAEINLENTGYCAVEGVNRCPKDKALSNGSGKSTFTSAICWALTGETIQGFKSDIKNINVAEKSCYVTLIFDVDNDHFEVTRLNEPKSDLKVKINGKDESGKGIRESQEALERYLPDLNRQLLASIIILGQGLPNKFSNNTPAQRKNVLEQLSKSDFMINDLKDRVADRFEALKQLSNDLLLKISNAQGKKVAIDSNILKLERKLGELRDQGDFDKDIERLNEQIFVEEAKQKKLTEDINSNNEALQKLQENIYAANNAKTEKINAITQEKTKLMISHSEEVNKVNFEKRGFEQAISNAKNMKDSCPTCKRPFANFSRPDTSAEEAKVVELNNKIEELNTAYNEKVAELDRKIKVEQKTFEINNNDMMQSQAAIKKELANLHAKPCFDIASLKAQLARLMADKANHEKNIQNTEKELAENKAEVETLTATISGLEEKNDDAQKHLDIVKKFTTILSRDFRGFLLSNIITYIDSRCKHYAASIFGSTELEFQLDGNNISISYCNKNFDGLSGGEKQKVDLIIQFAIRDMLSQYLNFSSNILVLDEVFDNLDALSSTNLINLITSNFNDVESIFIISHHADELAIPADTRMLVTKDEKGVSSVRQ